MKQCRICGGTNFATTLVATVLAEGRINDDFVSGRTSAPEVTIKDVTCKGCGRKDPELQDAVICHDCGEPLFKVAVSYNGRLYHASCFDGGDLVKV